MAIHDILVRVGADTTNYTKNLNAASQKIESFGRSVAGMGAAITGTFTAIAAAGAVSIGAVTRAASSYESAFAGVRKTTDATEEGFRILRKGILDMSKELPASANEIAAVAEMAGQLGVAEGDLLKFTRVMIDLGESTNVSAEDAAKSLAQFANITSMSMDDVDRLGSAIVDLGNNYATTESDIISMAHRLAGAGTQIGMSETDILGFAASLSSLGIYAEMGGSAMSRVFLDMNTAVQKGGEDLKDFAKVAGMSGSEFAAAFNEDAATAIVSFISGLGNLTESGENTAEVLDELGLSEIRVRDALLRASGASDLFTDSLKMGRTAWEENTALTDEASERYKTFASQMDMLKNRGFSLLTVFGEPFLTTILDIVDAMEPAIKFVEELANKFTNLDDESQKFITKGAIIAVGVSAIGAVLGVLLTAIGMVTMSVGAITTALGTTVGALALFATKVIGVITVITAIIGVVVKAYQKFEWFRDIVNSVWETIVNSTITAFEFIRDIITTGISSIVEFVQEMLGKLSEFWTEHGKMIQEATKNVWNVISNVITTVMNVIQDIMQAVWPVVQEIVLFTWEAIKGAIEGAIDVILGVTQFFAALFTGNWSEMWDAVKRILSGAVQFIVNFVQVSMVGKILKLGRALLRGFTGIIRNLWSKVTGLFRTGINNAYTSITGMYSKFLDAGRNIVTSIADGIKGAIGKVTGAISSVVSKIRDFLPFSPAKEGALRDIMDVQIAESIAEAINKGKRTAVNAMANLSSEIYKEAPKQLQIAGVGNVGIQGYAHRVAAEIGVNDSKYNGGLQGELRAIRTELQSQTEELRKQKETIIEMDKRVVGRVVEPYVSEERDRKKLVSSRARGLRV